MWLCRAGRMKMFRVKSLGSGGECWGSSVRESGFGGELGWLREYEWSG
jgi:hypothetical protein